MLQENFHNYLIVGVLVAILMGGTLLTPMSFAQENISKKKITESLVPEKSSLDKDGKKRIIIVYKDDVSDDDINDLKQKDAKIKAKYKIIPAVSVSVSDKQLDKIKKNPKIKGIFDDYEVHALLSDSIPQIKADQVHAAGKGGSGVRVCIVDTGVDDNHPNLNPLVAEIDYVNNDSNAHDDNGHGTHVAGIVASTHSTFGGVAPDASLMAAKVLDASGSGWTSDVISGIDWCVSNNADIISMSLGSGAYLGTCDTLAISIASNSAVDNGVAVFAASGNDGYINAISSPACASKVVAVGAVDKLDRRTPYSNESIELDIVAPGTSISSTYLNNQFATLTGTSMATPHVAGVAALILQTDPTLNPISLRNILENTSFDLGASGYDTIFGHGRVDAFAAFNSANTSPPQDNTPPIISNIASSPSFVTAIISWTTDEPANSVVNYGIDSSYGSTVFDSNLVTSHSMVLTGLTEGTLYHFNVNSTDAEGNNSASSDHTFTTLTPVLNSISVSPQNPSVNVDDTQQFTATGTYSDSSTKDITNDVSWSSSDTSVATISLSGLVTALSSGTSLISASLDGVSDGTTLSVTADTLTMHVQSIDLTSNSKGKKGNVFASVSIHDITGSPVSGATITVEFTGTDGTNTIATSSTDSSGAAQFKFNKLKTGNSFTLTVTNVVKSGLTYDPSSNIETSDSILI